MNGVEIIINGPAISPEDQRAVLQLPAEIDRAWNAHNAQAFAAVFDEAGDFRFHTGQWIKGRQAIERFWREEVFPTVPQGMRHIVTPRQVRFVTGDVAIGEGTVRIVYPVDGQERVYMDTEGTLLAVKREAGWRITAVRLAVMSP